LKQLLTSGLQRNTDDCGVQLLGQITAIEIKTAEPKQSPPMWERPVRKSR